MFRESLMRQFLLVHLSFDAMQSIQKPTINESVFCISEVVARFRQDHSQTRLQFDFDNKEEQQKSVASPPPPAPPQPSTSKQIVISAPAVPISLAAVVKSNPMNQPPALKVTAAVSAPPAEHQEMENFAPSAETSGTKQKSVTNLIHSFEERMGKIPQEP
jgi:hypothetical protein